jgi:hypothetical protein
MSPCCDGACSKGNYAAYVRKNMPHRIYLYTGTPDLYLHKVPYCNKQAEILLDDGRYLRHN